MTTTITVEACSWPVEVRFFPLMNGDPVDGATWGEPQRVEPMTKRTFHIHNGVDIMAHELPLPVNPAPPA